MTEGTSTSGALAATDAAGSVAAITTSAAASVAPVPVEAHVAAMATAAAITPAPSETAAAPSAPAVGPTAAAIAAAEAAAAIEAVAAKKADKGKKDDSDPDETSMSDAEMLPEIELASLGDAGAGTAGQAGLPCGVLPVVDAPVAVAPPPVVVPVGDSGFGFSPVLLGLLGLGALGLGYLLLKDDDDDDEVPVDENAPPVAADEAVNVDEDDASVTGQLDATDPDGDDLTYELDADVAGLTLNADGSYTFDVSAAGLDNLAEGATEVITTTYTVTDEDDASDTGTITITVTGVNDAPVLTVEATADIDENMAAGTVVVDADAVDPDGDDVVFSLEGDDAELFEIDPATGVVTTVGPLDFETQETYNITIVATDENGATDSQEVVVTVNDVDEANIVFLDLIDDDANPNTENVISAADGDIIYVEDDDAASLTRITGFTEGDTLIFEEGSIVSFGTDADDPNDLQIIVNNGGIVSEVILDDVLADDAGFVFNEASAETQVGFDFFDQGTLPVASETFA